MLFTDGAVALALVVAVGTAACGFCGSACCVLVGSDPPDLLLAANAMAGASSMPALH